MTTSGRVQVGTDQHTWPRGWPHPEGQWYNDRKWGHRGEWARKPTANSPPNWGGHREGPEPPQERHRKVYVTIENEIENSLDPKGWLHREESAQKGKRNRTNLRSDRGPHQPRPRRGDPIAKVANHMGEENPQQPAHPEQAGERRTGKKAMNPVAKHTVGAQPQDSKSTYLRLIAQQQMRPGEDSPLSKNNDKQGKSTATSDKKFRRSEGWRMNTTTWP